MHTEAGLDADAAGPAFGRFLAWCKKFLPEEKYQKFAMLIMHPLPTVELTGTIFSDLERALHGEDKFLLTEFKVDELEEDFSRFLESQGNNEFWRSDVFESYKSAVNSVLIVDLPPVQTTERPEPFSFIVKLENFHDILFNKDGQCEYCVISEERDDDKYFWIFDDEFFQVYRLAKGTYEFVSSVRHSSFDDLGRVVEGPGYCPARALFSTRLHQGNIMLRQNAITKSLGALDKVLFWETSIEYYETYGAFPMYWMYKETCMYEDAEGNECEDGWITCEVNTGYRDDNNEWIREPKKTRCPACLGRSIVGAGTVKEVDPPEDKTDADLREPMGYVGVDVNALTYVEKRLTNRKLDIYRNCVGKGGETPGETTAINEAQVAGNFESRQSRLVSLKKEWEISHAWELKTKAIFRYGRRYFIKSTAFYGIEFYLQSERALQTQLKEQRLAGAAQYQIAALRKRIDNTKYRENDDMRNRANVLSCLEPYPDSSVSDVALLAEKLPNFISEIDLELKANFAYYVQKFEREYMNVVRFGSGLKFEVKIQTILDKLYGSVKTKLASSGTRLQPIGYGGPADSAERRDGGAGSGK
jgi:hypothetical protein